MNSTSKTRIITKIEELKRYYNDLNIILKEDKALNKIGNQHGVAMLIQSIITAIIDIGDEIIRYKKLGVPTKYKEVFLILKDRNLISQDLCDSIIDLISYRNIIAHEYGYVEKEIILELLKKLEEPKEIIELGRKLLLDKI